VCWTNIYSTVVRCTTTHDAPQVIVPDAGADVNIVQVAVQPPIIEVAEPAIVVELLLAS
jgi:hypothetical protein